VRPVCGIGFYYGVVQCVQFESRRYNHLQLWLQKYISDYKTDTIDAAMSV